jgi:hypothetical protein
MTRDANSHAPPPVRSSSDNSGEQQRSLRDFRFWRRFAITVAMMAAINVIPLFVTWGAYATDGYEQIGWPLVFYESGGVGGVEAFYPLHMLGDLAVALGVSYVVARALKDGWRALFRKLQTWGLEHDP